MSKRLITPLSSGITSAPGDLPISLLKKREGLKAVQFRHDNLIDPLRPQPDQPVTVTATSGAAIPLERVEIWYTIDGSWPDATSQRQKMDNSAVEWHSETSYVNVWQATLPPQPDGALVRYKIAGYDYGRSTPTHFAHDGMGFWFNYAEEGITTFAYRVKTKHGLPEWMETAVIYHIFLDRFRGNAGQLTPQEDPMTRHGGTLQGIIDALPYLHDLGFTCLWLSPIGPADTYHRYDQKDFVAIDEDLGDEETMRRLVKEAHALGIRLVLDYVPSHASWKMPQFVAAQQDQNAATANWFVFEEWPHKYRNFLGVVPSLVTFNSNDDGIRQYLIDSAIYWLCEIGIDGLRLDHVLGHGMDFWAVFCHALEQAKPDVAIFGEATDSPDALRGYNGRLQAILDFPIAQALRMSFGAGEWDVAMLNSMLRAYTLYMQDGPDRVTFIDNHDMDRFLYVAKQDVRRLKMGLLCLLTLPHPPIIYYGTEIGMSQTQGKDDGGFGGDHVIRTVMLWNEADWNEEVLSFTKAAIALRHAHPTLQTGRWESALVDGEKKLYGYRLLGDTAVYTVLFNLGKKQQQLSLNFKDEKLLLSTHSDNELTQKNGAFHVTLAGLSGVVLG